MYDHHLQKPLLPPPSLQVFSPAPNSCRGSGLTCNLYPVQTSLDSVSLPGWPRWRNDQWLGPGRVTSDRQRKIRAQAASFQASCFSSLPRWFSEWGVCYCSVGSSRWRDRLPCLASTEAVLKCIVNKATGFTGRNSLQVFNSTGWASWLEICSMYHR